MEAKFVGQVLGVLDVHRELPKDENGVGIFTIRQLLQKAELPVTGLEREYICAFGAHGAAVLEKMITKMSAAENSEAVEVRRNTASKLRNTIRG